MTFVGFDLHKRYITACALNDGGEIIAAVRQLSTTVEAVLRWLSTLPEPLARLTPRGAHITRLDEIESHVRFKSLGVSLRRPAGRSFTATFAGGVHDVRGIRSP